MQGLHLAAGLPVAKALAKPVLMKISGSGIITILRGSFLGRLELDWLNRWAHKIMILNEGMRQEAQLAGLADEKLFWMPNPVDVEEFSPVSGEVEKQQLRNRLGLDPEAVVGIFVGRLAPEKELSSLVRAFGLLANTHPQAQLVIVGDGPLRKQLEAEAAALSPRIVFVGRQPMDRVRLYLRAADYFALVSSLEGFPCSLVEAMATGLPSVVSRIPANLQLIEDGVHGHTATTGDAQSLAEAITKLVDEAPRRLRMGQASRQLVVDRFSTSRVAEMYESLFASALSGRP
jgi:glycosyltransferase involved in cell wall biosynthesis